MSKTPADKPLKTQDKAATADEDSHVPEMAEDFEHTIRRLTIEKEKQREKDFGLYR